MSTDWHRACRETTELARRAIGWVNDPENQKSVGLERKAVDRRLRTLITELTKLDRSVDRPMSVSVFGPSQAGKSYLVSTLARKGHRPLMTRFSGVEEPIDFLAEINPGGGRESTGVVTRFSLRPMSSPAGFPVCLRLLTELELAKILGNSFFLDRDPKHPPHLQPSDVAETIADVRGRAGETRPADNRLSVEDLWDLQDYFERTFEGTRHIEVLQGLWDDVAELAPKLTIRDRADLLAPIWGRLPEFTSIFVKLVETLQKVDFATEAFCQMNALIPRHESIIDVETLKQTIDQDPADMPALLVRSFQGDPVPLPRPYVTALTAELHITITEKPWDFFEHTDLLDFPGARSRKPEDLANLLKEPGNKQLGESILRGKVAYLFERYVAEQELTSMLLCIKDSTQEVTTLPGMIRDWIAVSHGASPQDRLAKTTVLFFVLTMFDKHFAETAGDSASDFGERFESRMKASLTGFFSKDWVDEWSPGQAFRNCFWLRNPSFKAEALIEYDGDRELAIRSSKQAFVDRLREDYLRVDDVKRHFADPERAFDEALKLNDGGIGYLVERLSPICRPGLKEEQIAGRLDSLSGEMLSMLGPFHVDNDVEKRLNERRLVSQRILTHVQHLAVQRRFADLVAALQITEESAARVLYEAYTRRSTVLGSQDAGAAGRNGSPLAPPAPATMTSMPPLPGLPPLPGMPTAPIMAPVEPSEALPRFDSIEMYLARAMVEHWIGVLYTGADTDHLGQFFRGEPKLALELVNEVSNATRRLKLDEQLGAAIVRLAGSLNEEIDLYLEKATFVSCAIINRFVNEFGYDRLSLEERPKAPGSDQQLRPVFRPRKGSDSAAQIDLSPPTHQYELLADWMYGLHHLIESNAKSVDGLAINLEQNARIGQIIAKLGAGDGAYSTPPAGS